MYLANPRPRSGRGEATFLSAGELLEAGAWLRQGIERAGLGINRFRARLAEEGIATTASRLKGSWLGLHPPEAYTLRAICNAANLSYVEATDRFGYYREIIRIFDDLVWLGGRWLEEDDARGGTLGRNGAQTSHLGSLRDTGVMYWHGRPITWGRTIAGMPDGCDPNADLIFGMRYCVESWHEGMPSIPPETPRIVREAVKGTRTAATIVPKPIAIAILLATLTFPRRGDSYKEGTLEYRYDLGNAASDLVGEAKRLRTELRTAGRPKNLHPLLQRACDALDDGRIPFNNRRPMAAEYVVMWADDICDQFNQYARLAAFDFWGEAGGCSWTTEVRRVCSASGKTTKVRIPKPSIFAMLPQLREAGLPEIKTLTTYQ